MKAKFQYGIKSFSGKVDGMSYANYASRGVVIGRMMPENRKNTTNNVEMGNKLIKISNLYEAVTAAYKQDLELYSLKMYKLKPYRNRIAGNKFSTFVKMIWAASKDPDSPLDIMSLTTDDLEVGSYSQIETVKAAVENGYLPQVDGYEELEASAR